MNDTIRRFLRGACWVLALIVFVGGFIVNCFSWAGDHEMPYGLVGWAVALIIVLVLVGYWVGPLDSRTLGRIAAQIEAVHAGQAQLREEFVAVKATMGLGTEPSVAPDRHGSRSPRQQGSRRGEGEQDPMDSELRGFLAGRLGETDEHGGREP